MLRRRRRELEALRSRIEELERSLPRLGDEHEEKLRELLDLGPAPDDDDALARLEERLTMLRAERESLLRDRRTSLRAWSWRARVVGLHWRDRLRWWRTPRLGAWWQHPPAPVRVPRGYARATPPAPAPTISIVTPSFQQAEFLDTAIRSVVEQRYPALEYVVQDGGSDDGSVEVVRRWEHALHAWDSGPDDGQASAINRGFSRTSGEIMAWLNSDDALLPGAVAEVARYLAEHPEVDVVYGHRMLIDERNRQIGIWALPPHDDRMLTVVDYVPQETMFWRRHLWERVGGLDERFHYALDWDLLLRFRETGARFARLNRFMGAFRVHEAQKTTSWLDLGYKEADHLRERTLGRPMDSAQALRAVRGYRRRHVLHHTAHRIGARVDDRIPGRRPVPVPWLAERSARG